jgi:hypothetical protein
MSQLVSIWREVSDGSSIGSFGETAQARRFLRMKVHQYDFVPKARLNAPVADLKVEKQ